MARTITAPNRFFNETAPNSVFLAGTIDNGNSDDWQTDAANRVHALGLNIDVYNPRRDEWDPTLGLEEVVVQIQWELERLTNSNFVLLYFADESVSPISLLELGMILEQTTKNPNKQLFVVCNKQFWRHTNVVVTCHRYGIRVHSTLDSGLNELYAALQDANQHDTGVTNDR